MTFESNLPDYCKTCPSFDPEVVDKKVYVDGSIVIIDRLIVCSREKECYGIYKYLKNVIGKENNNE